MAKHAKGPEKRLTDLREELNFRIVVDLRTRIGNISAQQFSQCGLLTDVLTKQQTSTLLAEHEKAKSTILSNIEELNDQSAKQQETTRKEIIRLTVTTEGRLNELKEDMEKRHMELKDLLLNINKIHNTKRRQSLQERSKAISAALVAYDVIYQNLQISKLDAHCYSQTKSTLLSSSIRELHRLSPHPVTVSRSRLVSMRDAEFSYPRTNIEIAVSSYCTYYYLAHINKLLLGSMMHKMWPGNSDSPRYDDEEAQSYVHLCIVEPPFYNIKLEMYCFVWLMATILSVFDERIPSAADQFHVLAKVFDMDHLSPGNTTRKRRFVGKDNKYRHDIPAVVQKQQEHFNRRLGELQVEKLFLTSEDKK
ncbi:hypothetical protein MMC15_005486 [Xylographa vitiligo]|nr:hypothetical protein [Xylographa vitiligo]